MFSKPLLAIRRKQSDQVPLLLLDHSVIRKLFCRSSRGKSLFNRRWRLRVTARKIQRTPYSLAYRQTGKNLCDSDPGTFMTRNGCATGFRSESEG